MPEYEIPLKQLLMPKGPPPRVPPRIDSEEVEENEYEYLPEHKSVLNAENTKNNKSRLLNPTKQQRGSKLVWFLVLCFLLLVIGSVIIYTLLANSSNPQLANSHDTNDSKYCEPGYTWFPETRQCYIAVIFGSNYQEAEETCQADNAHLVSIHSEIESIFIAGLYHNAFVDYKKPGSRTKHCQWIGLHRPKGPWEWTDGSEVDYEKWGSVETAANFTEEFAYIGHTGIVWGRDVDGTCGYVCKKPSKSGEPERTAVGTTGSGFRNCYLGYYWFETTQSCYMVSTNHTTFEDAQRSCKNDNAELVSVHSNLENILLNGLIMKTLRETNKLKDEELFWLGLVVRNRTYTWTDGSETGFYHWLHGEEPRYSHGRDHFVCAYWNAWQPAVKELNGYICKSGRKDTYFRSFTV